MKEKVREFSKQEWFDRVERRKRGELAEPPKAQALPADANRKRVRTYVTMDPNARAIAKRIGNGVVSRGIDRALFHFDECRHRPTRKEKRK